MRFSKDALNSFARHTNGASVTVALSALKRWSVVMPAAKALLLLLLCTIDLVVGAYLAWFFGSATLEHGMAHTTIADNTAYILLMFLMLGAPLLVWLLRGRTSYNARLIIVVLPIFLFFALGGRFWVRLE